MMSKSNEPDGLDRVRIGSLYVVYLVGIGLGAYVDPLFGLVVGGSVAGLLGAVKVGQLRARKAAGVEVSRIND